MLRQGSEINFAMNDPALVTVHLNTENSIEFYPLTKVEMLEDGALLLTKTNGSVVFIKNIYIFIEVDRLATNLDKIQGY